MKVYFGNQVLGEAYLSTEHSASSYGIPVLVDEKGNAYGKEDRIRPENDPLSWYLPQINTAGELVISELENNALLSDEAKEAAKKFLGE